MHVTPGTPAFVRVNLALATAGFSTFLLMYAVQPLLPVFAHEFAISAPTSSLAMSVTTGCLSVAMLVVSAMAERWPRKPVMTASLALAAVITLAVATARSWPVLLALRTIEGIALAGLPSLAMAYVGEEVHPEAVGVSMGLYVGGSALGGMSGRLLTGVLTDVFSWRPAIAVVGGLGVISVGVFWWGVPASRSTPRPTAGVVSRLAYGEHLRDPVIRALVFEAFVILGVLVTVYNYIGFRLLAPPYGLSQTVVGSIFGLYLLGFVSSGLIGAASDRASKRSLLIGSLASMWIGVALTAAGGLPAIVAGVALLTVGFFAAHSVASSWVGLRADRAKPQAAALYLFFYYMGASVVGVGGGYVWTALGWTGLAGFLTVLLSAGILVAFRLPLASARASTPAH